MKNFMVMMFCLVLVFSMAGCGKSSDTSAGAPPATEFSTADEAVETIKAVKAAGPEKMPHPDDFTLYDKDYICLLKEAPLADFDQAAIMLVSQGSISIPSFILICGYPALSKVRTYSIVKRELCPNLLNRALNDGGWLTHLVSGVVSQFQITSDRCLYLKGKEQAIL